MAHRDAGHYTAKHAPGVSLDEKIAGAIREQVVEGELACADAERIGAVAGVSLSEVGRTLDLLETRISRCQLGLFGYGQERKGKVVLPDEQVSPELVEAIRSRLSHDRLPCAVAWEIAAEMKIARLKVSSSCEALRIKIKPCQLGAF